MYISMAVVYSRGSPYRKPVWTNWLFILALLILLGLSLGIILGKADWIDVLFEFKYEYRTVNMTENDPPLHIPPLPKIDSEYPEVRLLWVFVRRSWSGEVIRPHLISPESMNSTLFRFLVIGVVHFLLAYAVEDFLVNNPKIWKWCKKFQKERHRGKRYRQIIRDMEAERVI